MLAALPHPGAASVGAGELLDVGALGSFDPVVFLAVVGEAAAATTVWDFVLGLLRRLGDALSGVPVKPARWCTGGGGGWVLWSWVCGERQADLLFFLDGVDRRRQIWEPRGTGTIPGRRATTAMVSS